MFYSVNARRNVILLSFCITSTLQISGPATAQSADKLRCISDAFIEDLNSERYFKGYVYDGMLAECKVSSSNRDIVQSYIARYQTEFTKSGYAVSEKCNATAEEFLAATLIYAKAMRRAGAISIWRLVKSQNQPAACSAILHIMKNHME